MLDMEIIRSSVRISYIRCRQTAPSAPQFPSVISHNETSVTFSAEHSYPVSS